MVNFFMTIENNPIINNMKISLKEAQHKPQFILSDTKSDYYTILMLDPNAPSKNPKKDFLLHWMIINNNETAKKFLPPNPPKGQTHYYNVILLKQKKYIGNMEKYDRKNFDLSAFMEKYNLIIVKKIVFITTG